MIVSLSASLVVLASVGPNVIPIDEIRFRVQIVYDDKSPMGHAKAQIALAKAATKFCRGRGTAVSEGTLELNDAESLRKGKDALELGEVYRCLPEG